PGCPSQSHILDSSWDRKSAPTYMGANGPSWSGSRAQVDEQALHRRRQCFPVAEAQTEMTMRPVVGQSNRSVAVPSPIAAGNALRHDAQANAVRHHFTQPFESFHADAQRQHMAGGACMLFNVILQRATGSQADEGLVENLGEMHPAAVCERVSGGCYQGQTVLCDRLQLQALRIDRIGDDSGLGQAGGNGSHDVRTGALLQLDM